MAFIQLPLGNMFSYVTPGGKLRLGIKINKFHDCNMVNTDSWLTGFIKDDYDVQDCGPVLR